MFRIVVECEGLHRSDGPQTATAIIDEFAHRPWHQDVECTWDGKILRLEASNDFDSNGLALLDEFSDAITACVANAGSSDLRVASVTATD